MDCVWIGIASAFWLGILTSISPFPLATNLAAVSYKGRDVGRPLLVLRIGTPLLWQPTPLIRNWSLTHVRKA